MPLQFSQPQRLKFAKATLLAQDAIALKYRKKVATEIRRAARDYANAYDDQGKWIGIQARHEDNLHSILADLGRETSERFAMVPVQGIKKMETQFEKDIHTFVSDNAAKKAGGIAATTQDQVRKSLARSVADGTTGDQRRDRIFKETGGLITQARAATIARTEVHTAANVSQMTMIKNSGLKVKKEWISTNDDRVRDTHQAADGQTVSDAESFNVGGEALEFPGDPNGSAENVINCRCVIGYIPDLDSLFDEGSPAAEGPTTSSVVYDMALSQAQAYVLERGLAEGVEHASVISKTGKGLVVKRGTKSAVDFTDAEIKKMKGGTLVHNHPNSGPLSSADVKFMHYAGLERVDAIGHNGVATFTAVRKKITFSNAVKIEGAANTAAERVTKDLVNSWKITGGDSANEFLYHLSSLFQERAGSIDYSYKLAPRLTSVMKGVSDEDWKWANELFDKTLKLAMKP